MANKDCEECLSIFNCALILLLSVISLFVAPMINGNSYIKAYNNKNLNSWFNIDCTKYSVLLEKEINEQYEDIIKGEKNKCKRLSTMASMEYFVLFFNFSFVITYLFLFGLFYFDHNTDHFKDFLGLYLGIFPSIIMFVFSLIYVIYSGIVFTRDSPSVLDYKELMTLSLLNSDYGSVNQLYPKNGILRTDKDGAFAKYDIYKDKYKFLFPPEDENDIYGIYAKYNQLNGNQYNYNKKLYYKKYIDFNYEFMYCEYEDIDKIKKGLNGKIYYTDSHGKTSYCQFLYSYKFGDSTYNWALYNRWCLSLVFMVFIMCLHFCNIFIEISLVYC